MDNKEIIEVLKEDIHNNAFVIFCVSEDGSVTMITTGDISKIQKDICSNMIIVSGDHSIVLSFVLFLERTFENAMYKFKLFFERIFK